MRPVWKRHGAWIAAWCVLIALGTIALTRWQLARLEDAFETDARIAHRLLSQRMVEHDAVLAMLALLQPTHEQSDAARRLAALYPQILALARRAPGDAWPASTAVEDLRAAEAESRRLRHAALAGFDPQLGRYWLTLAAEPASQSLQIDLRATVPWSEWPLPPDRSPVRVRLELAGRGLELQPGRIDGSGWRFDFRKALASASQPFELVALREAGWAELPWMPIFAWCLLCTTALWVARAWQRQRGARERAEQLLRLGQVARLNAMGELAAGIAHELNQPLTAVLANTQAAARLLSDDPPDPATARSAMTQAAAQARRAADVVQRLRRVVERPDLAAGMQPVALHDCVRHALHLLAPELERCRVAPVLEPPNSTLVVRAEPVALEQIVHNLLTNALHALSQVASDERRLTLVFDANGAQGVLTVSDTGCGMAPEKLARVFEPFYSTREGGLGLGLSLAETLATNMGGNLSAAPNLPRGARFRLALPLAAAIEGTPRR